MKLGKVYYKEEKNCRLKKKFAFFPKILFNNEKIWWESYYSYQEYQAIELSWAGNGYKPRHGWVETFSCSTYKELKDFLRIKYREKKEFKENNKKFREWLNSFDSNGRYFK